MNINDLTNNKQVVDEQKFEDRSKAQFNGMEIFRELYHLHGGGSDFMRLDYWFYTDASEKAECLAAQLSKLSYEVEISDPGANDTRFCISGRTIFMKDDDDTMEKWVQKMNEIGFIHDCEFDGWGSPVENGGWFSDDTPEQVIRERLGWPPLENSEDSAG